MSRLRNILVTGPHRSGTTWIGNTIAAHGGMRILLEPFNRNFPPYGFGLQFEIAYTDYASYEDQPALEAAFESALSPNPLVYGAGVSRATQAGIKAPVRTLFHAMRAMREPRVLVKDPLALFSAGWLAERFDLDVICTMRSPWSFVASLKVADWNFSFKNIDRQAALMNRLPQDLVREMKELLEAKEERIEKWCVLWKLLHHQILLYKQEHPEWLFVRYEDVAKEPLVGFETMLRHVGLEMSPKVQAYIEKYTSSKNPNETNSTSYQPRDATKTIESWRERLTEYEIEMITKAAGSLATELYPDIEPS